LVIAVIVGLESQGLPSPVRPSFVSAVYAAGHALDIYLLPEVWNQINLLVAPTPRWPLRVIRVALAMSEDSLLSGSLLT
jgi:hypothetical protein